MEVVFPCADGLCEVGEVGASWVNVERPGGGLSFRQGRGINGGGLLGKGLVSMFGTRA